MKMFLRTLFTPVAAWLLTTALPASAQEPPAMQEPPASKWSFDASLYGLGAGMSGDVGIGPVDADVDLGFDKIWDNLEFGAMGKVRLGYDRWGLNTDVVYMGLGASKNGISADMDQWMVEPSISYRVCRYFEALAGVRYNNLSGEIRGPGILPQPRIPTGTQDWWDPIIGGNVRLPLGKKFSFTVRGDIGGFGAGSDFTWQAFPGLHWQISKMWSMQGGYRWLYMDYETGSGANRFKYDMLTQGPQLGFTVHF
jgi:hypothetical protein